MTNVNVSRPPPSSSLAAAAVGRGRRRRRGLLRRGRQRDPRGGRVRIGRADPADDLAVRVRLHRREDERLPAVSGTFALRPNSSNSPGAILPPSQVTVPMRSVTVSPSSFVIGFASFTIVTVRFQPGFG